MPVKQVVVNGRIFDAESASTSCDGTVVHFAFWIKGKAAADAYPLCDRKGRDEIVVDDRRIIDFGFSTLLLSGGEDNFLVAEGVGFLPESKQRASNQPTNVKTF